MKTGKILGSINSKKALFAAAVIFAIAAVILLLPGGITEKSESSDEKDLLEEKTADMLEKLDGISNVSVMISLKESGKKQTYTRISSSESELDGLIRSLYSNIDGAAVICKGGGDPKNQEKIISFISSLYGIPSNRIFVGE